MTIDPVYLLGVGLWGGPELSLSQHRHCPYYRPSVHAMKTSQVLRKGTAIPVPGGRDKYSPGSSQTGPVSSFTVHIARNLIGHLI